MTVCVMTVKLSPVRTILKAENFGVSKARKGQRDKQSKIYHFKYKFYEKIKQIPPVLGQRAAWSN